jgi:hypothetical protein
MSWGCRAISPRVAVLARGITATATPSSTAIVTPMLTSAWKMNAIGRPAGIQPTMVEQDPSQ